MRLLILALLVLCVAPVSRAQDQVPIAAEEGEEEVNFDEEEEVGIPDRPLVDFEQETSGRLLVFPLLFIGLLAWNVQWRKSKEEPVG